MNSIESESARLATALGTGYQSESLRRQAGKHGSIITAKSWNGVPETLPLVTLTDGDPLLGRAWLLLGVICG